MSSIVGFFHKHKNKLIILGVVFIIMVVLAGVYVYWKGKKQEEST